MNYMNFIKTTMKENKFSKIRTTHKQLLSLVYTLNAAWYFSRIKNCNGGLLKFGTW